MDGERIRSFFSTEVKALLDQYNQFATLIPSYKTKRAGHVGEDGRYVESLIRESLKKYLPKGIDLFSGFILRPSTKTGIQNKERKDEPDQHSSQLDIIVYDSERYPRFQRFDNNVIVPPEGVIGIISVKKTLREQNILKEVESLYKASCLCHCIDNNKQVIRGPFLAIVSMDSLINKKGQTAGEWMFSQFKGFYESEELASKLRFNDIIGLITSFKRQSIFKTRPGKDGEKATFVEFTHKQDEEYLSLQLILSGLLSVYYDPTRNFISRPGFTAFQSGRGPDRTLGYITTSGL